MDSADRAESICCNNVPPTGSAADSEDAGFSVFGEGAEGSGVARLSDCSRHKAKTITIAAAKITPAWTSRAEARLLVLTLGAFDNNPVSHQMGVDNSNVLVARAIRLLSASAQADVATTFAHAELAATQDLDKLALLNVPVQLGGGQAMPQ